MIRYELLCRDCGHQFDSWFANSAGYDTLAQANMLECLGCAGHRVAKALMVPAVARSSRGSKTSEAPTEPAAPPRELPANSLLMRQALRQMRQAIEKNAENVGPRFAEEVRRMHEGEAPARPVYGQATRQEVQDLSDAEVPFQQIPWVGDDS